MKGHNYAFQNADTRPHLQSRTQNVCFVISISAVILKRMVKITSIFGSYSFFKNSIGRHFLTFTSPSSKLEFVYPPCCGLEEQLMYSSERLLRVLKFGKTSNRAVKNLPQRKLLSLSSERCTLSPTELPRVFT